MYNSSMNVEYAWLAGWLEGEGCFYIKKQKNQDNCQVAVGISDVDEDVIHKARAVCGNIGKIYRVKTKTTNVVSWRVMKQADVKSLLETIQPYMCKRRSDKISQMLSILNKKGNKWQQQEKN